jgi:SPOR domain
MADRYQGRPFPASGGYDHSDDQHAPPRTESDPLAELARLIGQNDPFANVGRANPPAPRSVSREPYEPPATASDDPPPAGPPPWMQRATRHEPPPLPSYPVQSELEPDDAEQDYPEHLPQRYAEPEYPSSEHPLRRYATQHAEPEPEPTPEPEYEHAPAYTEADQPLDPSRYDDALYGQFEADGHEAQPDSAYADDSYAYQDEYEGEEPLQKRRGGLTTVMVVLALAIVGTGGAFAYRTYVGSARTGEPPIIKADTSPTKLIPAQDSVSKQPDRLPAGDGTEKIVPREETPVDVNANTRSGGPRMVFPPLNPNANPPSPSSVATNTPPPPTAANGTLPNNQPRSIKTFTVHGEQDGSAAPPAAAAATRGPATRSVSPAAANANANANAPLSLSPQGGAPAAPAARIATNAPAPIAPATSNAGAATGSYLVSVSSQKSETDAQSSYRVLQGKFPNVLGSRTPVIKRADLGGEKGTVYRAMVGPFETAEEASQFCKSLVSAGGQCFIPRN